MGELEAHQRVTGLQQRVVDGGVGLRAGVRLDVGVLGSVVESFVFHYLFYYYYYYFGKIKL